MRVLVPTLCLFLASGSLVETSGTIDAKTCSGTNSIKGGHLTFSGSSVIVSTTAAPAR